MSASENSIDEFSESFYNADDSDADPTWEFPGTAQVDCQREQAEEAVADNESSLDSMEYSRQSARKKARKENSWIKNTRQVNRNSGKEYLDRKGELHNKKCVKAYNHICRFKCNDNIPEEKRNDIFIDYWGLEDHNLESSFLSSAITLCAPFKVKMQSSKNRTVSAAYELIGFRVCKEFFMKTLDVSTKRVDNIVKKKQISTTGIVEKDKRGKKVPANKIPDVSVQLVKEHIESFPKYSSHYSRNYAPNRKYLCSSLTVTKMYALYLEFCTEKKAAPVKKSFYSHIFNTCFNISFHKPQTDTCVTCDKLQISIEHGETDAVKNAAKEEKQMHLKKAEAAKLDKDRVKELVKNDSTNTHVAICFDLQKMLQTPVLTCTQVYYARQLWTYNFCVHNLSTGDANMYMWNESQASRGCQEISSCLLKFINSLPQSVTRITAYSDNCGGQNKSHYIVQFWLYIIKNTHIEEVNHKFLLSGHSFMECDQNFGIIEINKKKHFCQIYVPQEWEKLVSNSSKKFTVTPMQNKDFISLEPIQRFFKYRVPGIRKMQWLHFEKGDPWNLSYKDNLINEQENFNKVNMKGRYVGRTMKLLPQLPSKNSVKPIKFEKYKSLQDLLCYIPPIYHEWFKTLPHDKMKEIPAIIESQSEPDDVMESDYDV